jgi:hypothetical protein
VDVRWYLRENPCRCLAVVAALVAGVGAMPAGFDYDRNVIRGALRLLSLVIGLPFLLANGMMVESMPDPRVAIALGLAVGFVPYLIADWRGDDGAGHGSHRHRNIEYRH